MNCAEAALVIAKIVSCGATREDDLDDEFSYWFSIELGDRKRYFQIPTPLVDGGYSQWHLETIENELLVFNIDLLPLDHNLMQ